MFIKHKLNFLITTMLILLDVFSLSAQSRKKSLQLKISGINFSSYERIKNHAEFRAAISFPITSWLTLRHEIGYYQYKHYWNPRSFEYRGTTYTSRNGQLWRDYSFISSLLVHPYRYFYFGTGIGIDMIYVKRIFYTGWTSFWVDQNDNVIEVWKEKFDESKICFSGCFISGWEQPIWRNISFIIEGKLKMIAVGDDLTGTNDSTMKIFSVFFGSSIKF